MDLDFIIFPNPKCRYSKATLGKELIYIPKYEKSKVQIQQKIKNPLLINKSLDKYNNTIENESGGMFNFMKSFQTPKAPQQKINFSHDINIKLSQKQNSLSIQNSMNKFNEVKNRFQAQEMKKRSLSQQQNNNRQNYYQKSSTSHITQVLKEQPNIENIQSEPNSQRGLRRDESIQRKNSYEQTQIHQFHMPIVKNQMGAFNRDSMKQIRQYDQENQHRMTRGGREKTNENVNSKFNIQQQQSDIKVLQQNIQQFATSAATNKKNYESNSKTQVNNISIDQISVDIENENDFKNFKNTNFSDFNQSSYQRNLNSKYSFKENIQNNKLIDQSVMLDEVEEFDSASEIKLQQTPKTVSNYAMKSFKETNSFNNFMQDKDDNDSIATETEEELTVQYYVPCLLLEPKLQADHILLYFHGNGEDINLSYELLNFIRNFLQVRIIAMEYPGYGVYKHSSPNAFRLLEDAEAVLEYLIKKVGYDSKNIILFGRSIGSGAATHLASKTKCGALVLMSAFTSLRSVVRDLAGNWASMLLKERFCNLDLIKNVNCPTFLIHGLKDKLIPYSHSQELFNACQGPTELKLPKDMDHIEFDFELDLALPLGKFLNQYGYRPYRRDPMTEHMKFPAEVYQEI